KSVENPLEFGIVVTDDDDRVERFLEKPSWGQVFSDTINTGIYVIDPGVLRHVPDDSPYDFSKELFPHLLEMGRPIYGCVLDGYWQDIGNLDQYRQANFDALDEKVQLTIPGIRLRGDIWIGEGVEIDDLESIEGPAFIGNYSRLAKDASLGAYSVLGAGVTLRERMGGASGRMARLLSGRPAPVVTRIQSSRPFRRVLEAIAGFDRRRILPEYAAEPLARRLAGRPEGNGGSAGRVVLFDDTYMNYHEPEVGVAAVELLESCGFEVIPARAGCCQRPRISHGFLREAKREGEKTLRNLDAYILEGLKIVVCEPSCASALVDDLPDLIDDEELAERIRGNVMMIDEFLALEIRDGRLDRPLRSGAGEVLIHGHCHQRALFPQTAMKEVLDRVEGLSVSMIESGCCGMAGSFGYEKEHYDLSMRVGEERLFPALRNRPEGAAVVACGFSCRHQIRHAVGAKAVHFVEVVRGA
ncbi:MAG: sugar phosphate nucleotidyltransferase, partial [Thermoleophilia bacterium]|nr:sugar phosphate nucleotidyltransferase [Thermoleophilia bacterium]